MPGFDSSSVVMRGRVGIPKNRRVAVHEDDSRLFQASIKGNIANEMKQFIESKFTEVDKDGKPHSKLPEGLEQYLTEEGGGLVGRNTDRDVVMDWINYNLADITESALSKVDNKEKGKEIFCEYVSRSLCRTFKGFDNSNFENT